jgi:UDP-N-acetylglucosamine/UDP-N-acetylgalactosamine diphosphorylase
MSQVLCRLYLEGCMKQQIERYLLQLGQPHLSYGIENLSVPELEKFWDQLQRYDLNLLEQQRQLLASKGEETTCEALPCQRFTPSGDSQCHAKGEELLRSRKVGCLILAGGQGTRLGFDGPKGAFPLIAGKSLFQIFCERIKLAGEDLPLCIMTSELNHEQTVDFFQEHNSFGLESSQLFFFKQGMLPFLDDSGNWLLEKPGKIAEGPDGNGHALHLFYKTGLWKTWRESGIEYLNVIFVDNVLADPFDPELIGFTESQGVDAVLKAVQRLKVDEKMGVLAEVNGKLKVIEYFELPSNASEYTLSSTGMFCLSMPFIESLCNEELPLHLSYKSATVLSEGSSVFSSVWKCERLLFELLDYAKSSAALLCPREKIYAPLKNATGDHSPEVIRAIF